MFLSVLEKNVYMEVDTEEEVGGQAVPMQLVAGQLYGNSIQVSNGSGMSISLDPTQHNYSTVPLVFLPKNTIIISQNQSTDETQNTIDSDTDVNDKVMASPMYLYADIKNEESADEDLIPDRLNQSISHHDYTGTVPVIQRPEVPCVNNQNSSNVMYGVKSEFSNATFSNSDVDNDSCLVIQEAVEQEVSTTSTSLEDEEIVRSKPLTAMYLQRKELPVTDSLYTPKSNRERKLSTPNKSPGSSRFTLKPSRTVGLDYDDLRICPVEDMYKMRNSYNDPVSVYHPNTGEIHFKVNDNDFDLDKKSPTSKRSVEAILAASETIKNQDIASEVEIGTCEVEVSQSGKRIRKSKNKFEGIEEDIEQIRKASKDVGPSHKGKGLGRRKDGKKRKKPRIRLTLTKAKHRTLASRVYLDESEENDYEASPPKAKRGRKPKDYFLHEPNIIYQCEYCEKQFKTRDKVRAHTKIHTEERAFGCDICGQRYRRREHLVRHYRGHTNDRPYECLECGKTYMRAEHLKRHSYDHTGEKPFECPICQKAFNRHDRLLKHSLVHDK
ncbi:ZFP14-like protein [Mya arenaria]|uniref:ZFP14-like protein n=1 Tax=Mya arenaria TaxID=6604 RepID=A0ABY7EJ08_MYAAR|nr:ZFP14-like protein [Mya arenaria]